ncbi:hypothetical protein B0H14DRAFT_3421459 [Mycena olivaceomarginata]|nr:hypothetical protein B0H14DRAFT_3421459 [Mycena olivaceomarginata]
MADKLYIGFAGRGVLNHMKPLPLFEEEEPLRFSPLSPERIYTTPRRRPTPTVHGTSIADNFIKFPLIHREIKRDPAFVLLRHETRFYAKHLNQLQDDIYGLFFTKSSWSGYLCCAIFRWFDGYPWDHLHWQRTQHDVLPVRLTIAAAAQKLHEMGLSHGQLFSGEEHHILYDSAQKMVMIVDFTVSAAGRHICSGSRDLVEAVCSPRARPNGMLCPS